MNAGLTGEALAGLVLQAMGAKDAYDKAVQAREDAYAAVDARRKDLQRLCSDPGAFGLDAQGVRAVQIDGRTYIVEAENASCVSIREVEVLR